MTTLLNTATTTRKALDKTLRSGLERVVIKARDIAEEAASQALKRLAVPDKSVPDYFSDEQKTLRNRLRAHGRQLGDIRLDNSEQSIHKLVAEVAYEHWHRMLFARFLEQNSLLMYDQHTMVTLKDCTDLIEEKIFRDDLEQACTNGWELAGVLASKMLPQIFRTDSPVFQLQFALELQRELETLVMGLAPEIFKAQDSLGWVYQFWQSKRKDEVNKSEVKIGADELSPVTQLFTEPYMVSFLLDNSLGAWWAGKRLSEDDWIHSESEQELRAKAAIPGVPLEYLRFVKENDRWQPASGFYEGWPSQLSDLKTLDPCCGSGHFLVATFLMLVPMRMHQEGLSAKEAVDQVLKENLHGLELDQRCVELAAFAVALEAWRYPNASGYRTLPELHLACSGLSISAAKDEWKELSKKAGRQNLSIALDWMYQTLKDAPVLGSLIDPKRETSSKIVNWNELEQELAQLINLDENKNQLATQNNIDLKETRVTAKGLIRALNILSIDFDLVTTNVPFRQTDDLSLELVSFIKKNHPKAKSDLATVFHDRLLKILRDSGVLAIVQPQGFLYKDYYSKFREHVFSFYSSCLIARLGARAFQEISGEEVKVILAIYQNCLPDPNGYIYQAHSDDINYEEKPKSLIERGLSRLSASNPLVSKKSILPSHTSVEKNNLLEDFADYFNGIQTGDYPRFGRYFWEFQELKSPWKFQLSTVKETKAWSGRSNCICFGEQLTEFIEEKLGEGKSKAWLRGTELNESFGVAISAMGEVKATLYNGELFDDNTVVIIPRMKSDMNTIWSFCADKDYNSKVRKVDQSNKVRSALLRVEFDKNVERIDIPPISSDDPTQWIYHGHPSDSLIWSKSKEWIATVESRIDETVLQVAVAKLLGYQWPAELDAKLELSDEQRSSVARCKALAVHADDDGIVCLPAVRGEKAAELRLEALLETAYGPTWTTPLKNELLQIVGSKSLATWLRDKFFEQHCNLFHHRPFIWQIWDGLKDGFSVLVNYHKLDKAGLERLIYTYLGDWIRTQQAEVANGVDGADVRLGAAQALKQELENILTGEKPYDIFVRWKPDYEQPIGWNPDINDGVRLNIRPFMLAKDMGKKGAGILRWSPNIKWTKDRGTDVESAPWFSLGPQYGEKEGARINEHHLTLSQKHAAREKAGK